jgi:hypothetical protein
MCRGGLSLRSTGGETCACATPGWSCLVANLGTNILVRASSFLVRAHGVKTSSFIIELSQILSHCVYRRLGSRAPLSSDPGSWFLKDL